MTIPGGYVAGDVLTASNMNLLPGGEIVYAQITADLAAFTTPVTTLTGLSVSFTAVAGRRYKFTAMFEATLSVGTDVFVVNLEDTVATLRRVVLVPGNTSANTYMAEYVNNSSISGAKTWRLNGIRSSGTGNCVIGATATNPSFVMVEDIGTV